MNRLDGKVAFLSGAARGIGGAAARLMAAAGARVAIGDVLEERGRQAAKEIEAAGGEALFVPLDVTTEAGWAHALAVTVKKFGALDVLVNNAGIFNGKGVEEATLDEWQRLVAVNLTGVVLGTRVALPYLKDSGAKRSAGAAIVNLASVAGLVGSQLDPLYSLTKGGVTLFTKSTALEFGRKGYNIRVNSVHPGVIDTDMGQQTFAMRAQALGTNDTEATRKVSTAMHPIGRLGVADGHRQGHRLSGLRRCRLHERRRAGGGRRLHRGMTMFRAAGYEWRLTCGAEAVEQGLRQAVERARAKRAFVICSPSVNRRTDTVRRIEAALGGLYAGVFDGIEKDSTYASVRAATDAAKDAGADLLIAAGGGSVLVAVRAVAIFLGETGDPFALMTQYPAGKPAYSPRLTAPKPPIVNIPTTPTSAMNRAGTGLKNPDLDHRMEYFDPKTRPQAILLDEAALAATPDEVMRSTATTVFASALAAMAHTDINPLAEASRDHAFRLAHRAYLRLIDSPADPAARMELALAAFESISTIHATKIRLVQDDDAAAAQLVAEALGLGGSTKPLRPAIADELERLYRSVGMPIRLSEMNIPRSAIPLIAGQTVKNFNANAGVRSDGERIAAAERLLEAAY